MNPIAQQSQETSNTELVDFWNEILAPKFIRYQHVLVGGLSRHSAAVMPTLDLKPGDRVLDIGQNLRPRSVFHV